MWDHKIYWKERRVFYVCYSSISLSPFPSIVYQIYWILSCNMSQQNCDLPRKCLFDIFPIRVPFSNFTSYMQTYTWVLYVMKVHYLQVSQLSTPIHLITGRNISMCPPGSTRHFQQSSHGFHARILEKKNKGKAYTFQGRACTRNKRQPTETGSTGSTGDRLLFIIWGVRGLGCVTWSHLTGIQLAVNLLKSTLKLCWRRLIPLPLPLKTMWSSPNSSFSHTT